MIVALTASSYANLVHKDRAYRDIKLLGRACASLDHGQTEEEPIGIRRKQQVVMIQSPTADICPRRQLDVISALIVAYRSVTVAPIPEKD